MNLKLEALEPRRLLSATSPAIAGLLDAQTVVAQPMVKTPSIVGTFKGTEARTRPTAKPAVSMTLTISKQTSAGKISGTSEVQNPGVFTGKIKGDSFTLTVTNSKGDVTVITGTVSNHGKTLSGTWTGDKSDSGTFSVSR